MKIFSGSNYQTLTNQIISELQLLDRLNWATSGNIQMGDLKIDKFSDGELLPLFRESVRDEEVFFINSSRVNPHFLANVKKYSSVSAKTKPAFCFTSSESSVNCGKCL